MLYFFAASCVLKHKGTGDERMDCTMKKTKRAVSLVLALCLCLTFVACGSATPPAQEESVSEVTDSATRTVTDMRGKTVTIPADPQRVAIFDKGFVTQTMTALGVSDRIVASGGLVQATSMAEERDSLTLCPQLLDLPQLGYPTDAVDFEALAAAKPDLVILRNSEYIKDSDVTAQAIQRIEEEFHIPLVVVNGPGVYNPVSLEAQYEGVELLGQVFGQEEKAKAIVDQMKKTLDLIDERTRDIPDEEKPAVMYIGLTNKDAVGNVWGQDFGDAKFSTEVAHIRNAYTEHGSEKMSAEQILALNPDVMILCTNSVRPHPDILKQPEYAVLSSLPAVQNDRVTSLGLLTWWGDFRLELPTVLLIAAKSAYPEQFSDIQVGRWLNEYHSQLYGLDEEQAQHLKEVQQLDWMDEADF